MHCAEIADNASLLQWMLYAYQSRVKIGQSPSDSGMFPVALPVLDKTRDLAVFPGFQLLSTRRSRRSL